MKFLLVSFLIIIGVGLTIAADIVLKKSNGADWKLIVLGVLLYGVIAVPVAFAFKFTEFGTLFLVWEAVAVIFGITIASVWYKEPFTIYRLLALVLALGALVLSYK